MDPNRSFPAFLDAWNTMQGLPTPAVHRRIAAWLDDRRRAGDRQLLLLAFRHSGKSTLLGLFATWLLAHDPDCRILVLAAESMLATKLVRHVRRVIEQHPETAALRPARREEWAADRLTVPRTRHGRDPSLLARGIAGNITGSHADVVICDDVEVPNTADTEVKRAELRDRLAEIEYVLSPDGTQIYIGTPHARHSIYAAEALPETGEDRPFLDGFARLVVPVEDVEGQSVWPERFTPEHIADIRTRTGPVKFASQMLLQPRDPEDCRLDPALLVPYEAALDHREAGGNSVLRLMDRPLVNLGARWDPAFGGGDGSVIAAVYIDREGHRWLHAIEWLEDAEPEGDDDSRAAAQCRRIARFCQENYVPLVSVEINGVGRLAPDMLRAELIRAGLDTRVRPVFSTVPKDRRILEAFDAVLAMRRLHVSEAVRQTRFVAELAAWRPGRRGRDDGLDAVAGCLEALGAGLGDEASKGAAPPRRVDWRPGQAPALADTAFEV